MKLSAKPLLLIGGGFIGLAMIAAWVICYVTPGLCRVDVVRVEVKKLEDNSPKIDVLVMLISEDNILLDHSRSDGKGNAVVKIPRGYAGRLFVGVGKHEAEFQRQEVRSLDAPIVFVIQHAQRELRVMLTQIEADGQALPSSGTQAALTSTSTTGQVDTLSLFRTDQLGQSTVSLDFMADHKYECRWRDMVTEVSLFDTAIEIVRPLKTMTLVAMLDDEQSDSIDADKCRLVMCDHPDGPALMPESSDSRSCTFSVPDHVLVEQANQLCIEYLGLTYPIIRPAYGDASIEVSVRHVKRAVAVRIVDFRGEPEAGHLVSLLDSNTRETLQQAQSNEAGMVVFELLVSPETSLSVLALGSEHPIQEGEQLPLEREKERIEVSFRFQATFKGEVIDVPSVRVFSKSSGELLARGDEGNDGYCEFTAWILEGELLEYRAQKTAGAASYVIRDDLEGQVSKDNRIFSVVFNAPIRAEIEYEVTVEGTKEGVSFPLRGVKVEANSSGMDAKSSTTGVEGRCRFPVDLMLDEQVRFSAALSDYEVARQTIRHGSDSSLYKRLDFNLAHKPDTTSVVVRFYNRRNGTPLTGTVLFDDSQKEFNLAHSGGLLRVSGLRCGEDFMLMYRGRIDTTLVLRIPPGSNGYEQRYNLEVEFPFELHLHSSASENIPVVGASVVGPTGDIEYGTTDSNGICRIFTGPGTFAFVAVPSDGIHQQTQGTVTFGQGDRRRSHKVRVTSMPCISAFQQFKDLLSSQPLEWNRVSEYFVHSVAPYCREENEDEFSEKISSYKRTLDACILAYEEASNRGNLLETDRWTEHANMVMSSFGESIPVSLKTLKYFYSAWAYDSIERYPQAIANCEEAMVYYPPFEPAGGIEEKERWKLYVYYIWAKAAKSLYYEDGSGDTALCRSARQRLHQFNLLHDAYMDTHGQTSSFAELTLTWRNNADIWLTSIESFCGE